jgi:hypothetical protein
VPCRKTDDPRPDHRDLSLSTHLNATPARGGCSHSEPRAVRDLARRWSATNAIVTIGALFGMLAQESLRRVNVHVALEHPCVLIRHGPAFGQKARKTPVTSTGAPERGSISILRSCRPFGAPRDLVRGLPRRPDRAR